ncbi:MotB family protein [Rhizobium straminoryzae]|uniref:MotB family protein n=1 Tax=Rhizobium straminoryzae TaxID=1387186 RepID=A0A549TID4_9HYPH|nr:MotB family protein [Rhizobium straminoryzae]TRL43014.1 MotB family protein [Rhizobium straminoryzae]
MSEQNHHHGKNEIIIVKKHGGGHGGAHGGAWKIAYADFMTAMMAFFLVMWLVNASNEETKASVASYFNPIKLSDETPAKKGLQKPVESSDGQEKRERSKVKADADKVGASAATGEDQTSSSGDEANYSEADFFENPYSVLAEIAQEVGQQANVSAKGEGGANDSGPATGAEGGEAFRDPFDPDFWTQQVETRRADGKQRADAAKAPPSPETPPADAVPAEMLPPTPQQMAAVQPQAATQAAAQAAAAAETPPDLSPAAAAGKPPAASAAGDPSVQKPTPAQLALAIPRPRPDATPVEPKPYGSAPPTLADRQKAADDLRQAIENQIAGVSGKLAEGLIVTPAEGGVLITLSDQTDTPMFNIGSAVPRREMVLAMEKIGAILKQRAGDVVIRGHTDGRPFRDIGNDNWRLSAARAHSAYFMLVKGGLEETRVKQISGFADRRLQVPADPLADQNRRIEILLEDGKA